MISQKTKRIVILERSRTDDLDVDTVRLHLA